MVFNAPFNNISAISRSVCIWKIIWKYQSCKNKMTVQRKYITMTTWRCGAIFWLSTCLVNVIPEARRAPTLDIYVYLTIAVSLSLLVDYWTPRVSSDHESVLRHRCVITSTGGLLDTDGIIRPWVSASPSLCHYLYLWTIGHRGYHPTMSRCFAIAVSLPLQVDYWTPRVSSDHESMLRLRCVITSTWRTIGHRGYHPTMSQCFAIAVSLPLPGGLLDTEGIIRPWVSASPSLCHYLYWWTIGYRGYHPTMSQCFAIAVSLPLLVDYWTPRVSSDHESVLRHWHCLLDFTSRFIFFGWLAPKYYELTWWKVLQKRIVRSKLDIYFFLSYQQNVKFVFFSAAVALFNGILYVYLLC
jgi:hypothetical protein